MPGMTDKRLVEIYKLIPPNPWVDELFAEIDRLRGERVAHIEAVRNLAAALFPDSPVDSAMAEFDIDAMGACQVIRRLRGERRKEVCICAAVIDPITGEVVRGQRHAGLMAQIWGRCERPTPKILDEHQGFITSHNRFVSREEGLRLQKEAGIESACKGRGYLETQLTSEDLYAGEY